MTKFEQNWLTSTLAPESIITKPLNKGYIHSLVNEDKSKQIFVLEVPNGMLLINKDVKLLLNSKPHTNYKSACVEISKELNLIHHSF